MTVFAIYIYIHYQNIKEFEIKHKTKLQELRYRTGYAMNEGFYIMYEYKCHHKLLNYCRIIMYVSGQVPRGENPSG